MIGCEEDSGFLTDLMSQKHLFTEVQQLYVSKGGVSICYKAKRDGKWFILKAIKPEFQESSVIVTMWDKEFDYSYNCDHSNIARTYGREFVEGIGDCIVQEYIDGLTLKQFITARYITSVRASRIIKELCNALSYIHCKGIIHRDLRPENIMITNNGNHVKLIDFGYADSCDSAVMKAPAGTYKYASPEVLAGEVPDGRSDIYAIGLLIYDMFGGRPRGSFKKVAKRCLAQSRDDRYQYADDIIQDLITSSTYKRLITIPILIILIGVLVFGLLSWRDDKGVDIIGNTKVEQIVIDTLAVEDKVNDSNDSVVVSNHKQINGVLQLPHGQYVGEILDGVPHGNGAFTYCESYLINSNDSKLRYSEKGDTFIGKFYAGVPEYGKLYNSRKELKATMNFGRTK